MAPGDYASVGSGKLKLKGVKDSKVDKKKKKKSGKLDEESADKDGNNTHDDAAFQDKSVVLKSLEDEDERLAKEDVEGGKGKEVVGGTDTVPEERELVKTEAERRYEEQRRKKLMDRLKREGVKTHKERVEELNRYLSRLSEHHDMPRIGPG